MLTEPSLSILRVLLVDDDPVDVRLTLSALRQGKVHLFAEAVHDGVEAMAYLRREGRFADARPPDLILLDLNMPKMDGREVLTAIRADPNLHNIPVVVLTTSRAEQDVIKSYDLGANAYVVKPVDLDQVVSVVNEIEEFWLTIVKLPPKPRS
jgi:chemotaxis family two-component system response regulator Rcp1